MTKTFASNFKKVTHCIFDMDGLILDTEKLYTKATQSILDKYVPGTIYTWDVKATLMGLQNREVSQRIVDAYNLPLTWEEYSKLQKEANEILMVDAELLPGAERLIRHLHVNNVPFALATSSGAEMVDIKIIHHQELFKLFHHRVCGSTDPEVTEGKPSPAIFHVAAARFPDKPEPAKCLVFEDAPNGVQAAHAAGMQSIMVPDEHVPAEMCKLATKVLKSLEEFKPEEFGLPAFKA